MNALHTFSRLHFLKPFGLWCLHATYGPCRNFDLCHLPNMMKKKCIMFVCVTSLIGTFVWLAPGGTLNAEFACFYVLLQTAQNGVNE